MNGTFDIRYRLTLQPDTLFLVFYNDYQGKWAEKFTLATMPEHEGALTHFSVPTIGGFCLYWFVIKKKNSK